LPAWEEAELTDEYVSLRAWQPDDRHDAFRDPELGRFFGSPFEPSDPVSDPEMPAWAILDRRDGRVVGRLWCRPGARPPEIGYYLRRDAWGNGYATRALRLGTEWLLSEGGFERVELCTHPENERSKHVAVRAGYEPVGEVALYARFKDGTTRALRFVRTSS